MKSTSLLRAVGARRRHGFTHQIASATVSQRAVHPAGYGRHGRFVQLVPGMQNGGVSDSLQDLLGSPLDDEPRGRSKWIVVGVVAIVVIVVVVWVLFSGSDDPVVVPIAGVESSSSTVVTTIPVVSEPVLILDDPPVSAAKEGPEPDFETDGLGEEQFLTPYDGVNLDERAWLEEMTGTLEVKASQAVGVTFELQHRMLVVHGTVIDPYMASYGAPGRCYRLANAAERPVDCFGYDLPGASRPLFMDQDNPDDPDAPAFLAWGMLPGEVSVAVLSVNGVDVAWQRPRGSTVVFRHVLQRGDQIEMRALDVSGIEIDSDDRSWPAETSAKYVEPILGYGDFSNALSREIDAHEVNTLIVKCMNDQGVPAVIIPPELARDLRTIDLSTVPEGDRTSADLVHARCRAGLNLPEVGPRVAPVLQGEYEFLASIQVCLTDAGIPVDPPPPVLEWVAIPPKDRWDPFRTLGPISEREDVQHALAACFE